MKVRTLGLATVLLLGSLATGAEYESAVRAKVVLKTTTTSSGQKLAYPVGNPEVTAMTVEIPPGVETGWHFHPIPVYAWVVSGSLTVDLEGGRSTSYSVGDPIVEAVNVRHNGRNTGDIPVKLLVFYTGI